LLAIIDELLAQMTVVLVAALTPVLAESEIALKVAAASRNGSIRDAHVLALARCVEADVWSTDRDFAGTGVASWSTPNLMRSLAGAARDHA
jgi:predicted nucleic acid-binding protein